jgi:hypothetical protein
LSDQRGLGWSSEELDKAFAEVRGALGAVTAQAQSAEAGKGDQRDGGRDAGSARTDRPEPGDELVGVGVSPAGLVRARAATGGLLTSLELDPQGLRLPSEDLAGEVLEAVNAALTDLRNQTAEQISTADVGGLDQQLREVQDQGVRQMERFTRALDEALHRLERRK